MPLLLSYSHLIFNFLKPSLLSQSLAEFLATHKVIAICSYIGLLQPFFSEGVGVLGGA